MEEVLIKKIKDLERKREEAKKMKKKLTNDIQVLMKKNIEYENYISRYIKLEEKIKAIDLGLSSVLSTGEKSVSNLKTYFGGKAASNICSMYITAFDDIHSAKKNLRECYEEATHKKIKYKSLKKEVENKSKAKQNQRKRLSSTIDLYTRQINSLLK